jgi:ATP synthase protein I
VSKNVNFRLLSLAGQVGVVMVILILLGLVAGLWIDDRLGTSPTFTLVFILLGIGAGAWSVARMVMWALQGTSEESSSHKE